VSVKKTKVVPLPTHLDTPKQAQSAVRLLATAVAGLGLLNLWSALLAKGPGRARFLIHVIHLPLLVEHGSRTLITLFGLFLLVLARSLAHRKRQAWRITMVILTVAPFFHLAKGLDWEEAIICIGLLLVLFFFRSLFWAENDQPSARQGIAAAAGLFLFAIFYGPVGFLALHRDFRPHVSMQRAINESVQLLTFGNGPQLLMPATMRGDWFEDSLQLISTIAAMYAIVMILRPVLPRDRSDDLQRMRARWLLSRWGGEPISYFILLPDKRYLFAEEGFDREWCIAYRVIGRRAVALGDPIGDPDYAEEAITRFLAFCRVRDWQPSFYQIGTKYLDIYRKVGLRTLKVGQDSWIDLKSFSLKGKSFQDLRTALNKMKKLGIEIEYYGNANAMDTYTITELSAISSDWLQSRRGVEKSFAMGSFSPHTELFEDSRVLIARDQRSRIVLGFVTFVPIFCPSKPKDPTSAVAGWALDLMRRRADAMNGIMEFLITSAALKFQAEGAGAMSLGLSALAESDDEDDPHDDELFVHARQLLYKRFNFTYSFDGLFSFKNKFGPLWQSRYLAYDGHANLLSTIYAILEAHSRRFLILRLRNMLPRFERKSTNDSSLDRQSTP
jgi:phosphatidylglycerol lysyltransferase